VTMTTETRSSHGTPVLRGEDRRRSQRVLIRMRVTLELALEGKRVTIEATTESVNDHGAMILCPRALAPETQLQLKHDQTRQQKLCRVTRTAIESADGFLVPVEFSDPAPGFWGISFPPSNWKPVEE
jgi:hypothetical protein